MKNGSVRALLFLIIATSIVMLSGITSAAQDLEVWTNLGLYGGQMYDIAIDHANPEKMFAGAYLGDGLFVTTNGGGIWQAVVAAEQIEGEDTFRNHAVWAVKIAPSNSSVIWASHNYWVEKSADGGETWTHIWNGVMQSPNYGTCSNCPQWDQYRFCKTLAVDPSDSQTVYVGTTGAYTNYWNNHGAIYRTADGGETWAKLKNGEDFDGEVVDLAVDENDPKATIIWAVTSNGGVFIEEASPGDRVSDGTLWRGEINRLTGEETWTEVFSMDGGEFYDVEIKPNDSSSIFTANDWGIFRHYQEGDEWKYQWILNLRQEPPLAGEVFARNVRALAFDPQNPDILYAAWKNSVSKWENIDTRSKIARGTPPYENGNWEIYTTDYQFLTLAVHPTNSEFVFGGELFRGVYQSQDHGQNWTPVNNGINSLQIREVEVDPNDTTHHLAATSGGVYEKRGNGDWQLTSKFEYTAAFSVAFDPNDTDGSTYYAGTEKYLAKTTNSGADWILSDELPNETISDIAVTPDSKTVFGTTIKGVYRNENGLSTPTLTRVLSSETVGFNVVVIDPNDSHHIFAGSGNYFGTYALGSLYESKAGGDEGTWQLTGLTDVIVNDLLIDPRDSKVMYAGCGYSGGTSDPVFKSSDGGLTWAQSFEGIPDFVDPLKGIWGTSATNVFVVGVTSAVAVASSIWQYDGSAWTRMDSGTAEGLYGVWGSTSDNFFAVGDNGTILHYDGSGWTAMSSDTGERLYDVWGSSATDVFAVGVSGAIVHFDGNTWSAMSSGATEKLEGIWGNSATDVFAVGDKGTILHYDGNSWTSIGSGTTEHLWGVWGSSATDVFVVGASGAIVHYDGNTWSAMSSGTTDDLEYIWGSSAADVFAVGAKGTILHYDGSSWTSMDSGITDYIISVWGSSEVDVFAVGTSGAIVHYNGSDWAITKLGGANWNSVTDMEFHRENKDIIYASTTAQGVYVSPNQAGKWVNLGKPGYDVHAISISSLYAATEGGLYECTGTGVIAGKVANALTNTGIDQANVWSDFGVKTISVMGEYMMSHPTGIFDVFADAERYFESTISGVTVLGGDVTWTNIPMQPVFRVIDILPHDKAGIDDSTRVSNDTSFAVLITSPDGVDITDQNSIKFTIDDGVNEPYTRNLGHSSVRAIKVRRDEEDTNVTKFWAVYDRSKDAPYENEYAFDSKVNMQVEATDKDGMQTSKRASFKIETQQEHDDELANIPDTEPVDPTDPALSGLHNAGTQVSSGDLKGAKILYNSSEPILPRLGPLNELPAMDMEGSEAVGVPLNLQPHTVFETPVKIFIPCPGWSDVSSLSVYVFKDDNWALACDADGQMLSGGDGWMVPGSRVNHNNGSPSTIEIQVYRFSGAQATSSTSDVSSDGSSSGGGGCFIDTAAYGLVWPKM
jgi:hypothetical protein